jgi:hypothetical protein
MPTWHLHACTTSFLGPTKNLPLPWSAEEDAHGRRAGTAPLRCRETSLSWRGRQTAPRNGRGHGRGVSSLQNLPLETRAIPALETRLRQTRGRRKPEKGIDGGAERLLKRFGCANDTMINNQPSPMKERGQVYSNEEQFAFPMLICNQILYHVFLHQP